MLAVRSIKKENFSRFAVGHKILAISGKVEMGNRAGVLLDNFGLSELGLGLVEPDSAVLASNGAQVVIWREFDNGDCLSCLAVLCLCHRRKFFVDHQEVTVTHTDCDSGTLIVVGNRVSTAFESCVSDLAPGRDVPNSEDAILANS